MLLGMSGGVDSSAAAVVLQQQGFEVVGATMKLWPPQNGVDRNVEDAQKVCDKLGIEHHVLDFTGLFLDVVVQNFIDSYEACKTPNPCVLCNRYLKFGALAEAGERLGAAYIA